MHESRKRLGTKNTEVNNWKMRRAELESLMYKKQQEGICRTTLSTGAH